MNLTMNWNAMVRLMLMVMLVTASVSLAQNQPAQRVLVFSDTAVATDAYTGCPTTAITSYVTGMEIRFLPATNNTGAATINICALGAIPIKKLTGADPDDGDIKANKYVRLVYDGTNAQIVSGLANEQHQTIPFVLDGGGSVLTTYTSIDKSINKACSSRYWYLSADAAGNLTINVERAAFTTGTPSYSVVNTLTLTAARAVEDTTAVSFADKDMVRIVVTGTPATITKASFSMRCF